MSIIRHADQPLKLLQRAPISSRSLVTSAVGTTTSTLWEQFMPPGARIQPHYHDVEELVTVLSGTLTVTLGEERQVIAADTTLFIPAQLIHSLQNMGTAVVRTPLPSALNWPPPNTGMEPTPLSGEQDRWHFERWFLLNRFPGLSRRG